MASILMTGWRDGMKKVSLSKLQMEYLKVSLSQAKMNVDKLLDGEQIKIEIDDLEIAREFIKRADDIGVDCLLNE
jgi:hypothetical protein